MERQFWEYGDFHGAVGSCTNAVTSERTNARAILRLYYELEPWQKAVVQLHLAKDSDDITRRIRLSLTYVRYYPKGGNW